MKDSNQGEVGVESVRLNGSKLGHLPPHQGWQAQLQIPEALKAELDQQVQNILARYPRTTKEYLESRLRECRTAIKDFKRVKKEKAQAVKDMVNLAKCVGGKTFKDIELELYAIGEREDLSFEEKKALIKEKRQGVSEYDRDALYEQVQQFQEDIERLDAAIESETDSIAELNSTLGKIEVRDAELKALGVTDIQ